MKHLSIAMLLVCQGMVVYACGDPSGPGGACAKYPEWTTSPYALPYPIGSTYQVAQANCSSASASWNSHQVNTAWTFAYDFLMPIGAEIAAVRGGTVAFVRENLTDNDKGLEQGNIVVIDHGDSTFAGYGHITHQGVLVDSGQVVEQGDVIALSGSSGESIIPHLHFQVSPCLRAETCGSIPVTFRNTRANPTGLRLGDRYEALPGRCCMTLN